MNIEIAKILTSDKVITVEHPGMEGFKVQIAYMSKEMTQKLIDKATEVKFDRKTHRPMDSLNSDLFLELFTKELIRGWSGLTVEYLKEFIPLNDEGLDPNSEIEYSEANAITLMKNSPTFDQWLSSISNDVSNFNKSS